MRTSRSVAAIVTLALWAGVVAAQTGAACSVAAPGTAFGITGYTCTTCGFIYYPDSGRTTYSFGAEPQVYAVLPSGVRVKPGDVIVAVNGYPITTRAGADQFAYPPANGESTITVRRNGVNIDVEQIMNPRVCSNASRLASDEPRQGSRGGRSGTGPNANALRGSTGLQSAPNANEGAKYPNASLIDSSRFMYQNRGTSRADGARSMTPEEMENALRNNAPARTTSSLELRNFGIMLSCRTECALARTSDGRSYWRFEGYPAVSKLVTGHDGLAYRSGLREGDVIVSVNKLSPLTPDGAMLLSRADAELVLRIEVSRDGKRQVIKIEL